MNERRLDSLYAKHIFDGFFFWFLFFVFCCCCWIYVYLLRIVRQCSLKASFLRKVSKEPSILVMKQKLKSEINKKRAIERKSEKNTPFQRFNKDSSVFVVATELPLHFFWSTNETTSLNTMWMCINSYFFWHWSLLGFVCYCLVFGVVFFLCIAFARDFVVFLLVLFPPLLLYVFLFSSALCVDIHLHWNESALKIVCAIQP